MLVTMLIMAIVVKLLLPIHISVLAVYEKDINPEIKINDIKRFIVNSSASVQYENISVVLSKRRDIIEQAPTYEISEPVLLMIRLCRFLSYLH